MIFAILFVVQHRMRNDWAKIFTPAVLFFIFGFWLNASAQNQSPLPKTIVLRSQSGLPILTQVAQIRRLSLSEAERHYPVKLRAVVLDYSTLPTLFVSDKTNGIFVRVTTNQVFFQGQLLEIDGVSDAGRFSPVIVPTKLKVVGNAELPTPRDASFQSLVSGAEDSQWVRVKGVIRSTAMRNLNGKLGKLTCPELTLATEDGGRLSVLVNNYHGEKIGSLIDAEVVIAGVVESIYNGKRQLISVRLLVPDSNFVEITRAAPPDLMAASLRPIDSLRQFSPDKPSEHRVKVEGIVTLQQPGESIFIRDGTGNIQVETKQGDIVSPGDRVEALGFPAVYDYTPVMEDAVFHKTGTGPPPQPAIGLFAKEIRWPNHEADLIQLKAQLLDQYRTPDQLIFVLQEGDILFRAQLARSQATRVNLRNGAQLQITGICLTEGENYRLPQQTFQMILRSQDDLVVLHQPSWWTPERLRWTLCLLTIGLLAAGIWVWTLRRQVLSQTETIREKIEREAVLQERMRIARELHDNLEQELAGVRMQLELTAATVENAPHSAVASLQMAKTMINHSQVEARRSVWELRSQVMENRTLPAALSATAGVVENGAPIEVKVSGRAHALPMRIESNLLRIAQEAITNAIKHAKPRQIIVHLAYETNGTRLKISDDGCGFYVDKAPDGQTGHFGLLGIRERVDKIAATLQITSAPGEGTSVDVFVPQSENEVKSA
jgi:signal transduction histidine kinase